MSGYFKHFTIGLLFYKHFAIAKFVVRSFYYFKHFNPSYFKHLHLSNIYTLILQTSSEMWNIFKHFLHFTVFRWQSQTLQMNRCLKRVCKCLIWILTKHYKLFWHFKQILDFISKILDNSVVGLFSASLSFKNFLAL